ncbi:hypothetical protein ACQJ18_28385 [Priestia megaterium]|uniref:hypothetical protein n=1 Tax=Priestia megaterium TaxID=1404 RepID=UPI003CFFA30D
MDFGLSIFPQLIANKFLQSADYTTHRKFLTQELLDRRNAMISALHEILGEKVNSIAPNGGLHIWCKINQKISDEKLVEGGRYKK